MKRSLFLWRENTRGKILLGQIFNHLHCENDGRKTSFYCLWIQHLLHTVIAAMFHQCKRRATSEETEPFLTNIGCWATSATPEHANIKVLPRLMVSMFASRSLQTFFNLVLIVIQQQQLQKTKLLAISISKQQSQMSGGSGQDITTPFVMQLFHSLRNWRSAVFILCLTDKKLACRLFFRKRLAYDIFRQEYLWLRGGDPSSEA